MKRRKNKKQYISSHPIRFAMQMSKPHTKWAVLALLASTTAEILETSVAYIFRGIIDSATLFSSGEVVIATVFFWVVAYPATIVIMQLLWRASGFTGMRWVTGFNATAQTRLFAYLTDHSHTYFANRFAGALVSKIGNAINGMSGVIESFMWNYLPTALSFVVAIFFAWLASPILALVFVFWIGAAIPVNIFLAKRVAKLSFDESKQQSKLRGIVVDVFSNIVAVQQYARRMTEQLLVGQETEKLRKAELKSWIASETQLLINNIVFVGGFVVSVVAASFYLWQGGSITLGEFVMALTLTNSLIGSLTFIGMSMRSFAERYGNSKEGLEEILIPHGIVDYPKAKDLVISEGEINFEKVGFSYGTNRVFKKFNLAIGGGERIGLVGSSGSGKTTLISLLLRQQDIHEGNVLIDGQVVRKVKKESLNRSVATVPQEPALFHRSIKENIAYGNTEATDEEIYAAAKKAQAHEFIQSLPDGYDTLVGERGVKLSGGQRQRVAIARAILKDAPILVLDEATSALDSESEVEIQTALRDLMKGKTVIAIAHRLSTLREMDRIIVLEDGVIAEDGSHDDLVEKKDGIYSRLWDHQAGGFLQDEE